MAQYKLQDFNIGDSVYHLSNHKIIMVVIKIQPDMNEISCRWIDAKGIKQTSDFMPEELGKSSDLGPKIFSF